MERTILEHETIYINGGSRGFLLGIRPSVVIDILKPRLVDVAIEG